MATPIYGSTEWAAAQATPWLSINPTVRLHEAILRGSVADRDLTAPPGACADGAAYLVLATGTGAWASHDGQLAVAVGTNAASGWLFAPIATEGATLWVDDENIRIQYNGAAWVSIGTGANPTESMVIAASDETTALTTGTAKVTFRMPYAFTLTAVRASVTTAPTGAVLTVDINEAGASILSTKITIDVSEKTSTTAATAPVISDTALADDAEMTIDIDTVGSTIAGAGLKVYLIGSRT